MSSLPKPRYYSLEEYFALELASDRKYVFHDGIVTMMAGAQPDHNRIQRNIIRRLDTSLENGGCEVFGGDQRVKVEIASPYLYPDISVACPKPKFESVGGVLTLINPTVIIEVLSPSTAIDDRNRKFAQYQTIGTLKEYVLVDSGRMRVTHFLKQKNRMWMPTDFTEPEQVIRLNAINCELRLAEIYRTVVFPEKPARKRASEKKNQKSKA
jgi:Uma2 family endonuclease